MRLVEAGIEHIPFIAANMRADDIAECAACGRSPEAALTNGLRSSLWALTAIVDDEPHAMMGVVARNMLSGVGVPWMLGTDMIYAHARDMIRCAPVILGEMAATFSTLENLVSVDNERAIRFLQRVGFEFSREIVMVGGTAFIHFRKGAA